MPDINMQVFEEVKRNQLVAEIDIQTQVALDDYQVQLSDIANPTQSQDNVVIDRNGEFLPHWNESLDFDTWVKMSMEVAGKRLLVLHGNTNINSPSSIGDASEFGDDFKDNSIDGAKWSTIVGSISETGGELVITRTGGTDADIRTVPSFLPGHAFRAKLKYNLGAYNHQFGFSNRTTNVNWASHDDGAYFYKNQSTSLYSGTNNEATYTLNINAIGDANYHIYDITWLAAQVKFYKDSVLLQTHTTNIPDEACYSGGKARSFDGSVLTYDWIFIHKYTATSPTWTADSEEQNIAVALKSLGRAG